MSDFPLRSFTLGPLTVYAFGLVLAIGGLAAFALLWLEGRKLHRPAGSATGLMALCLLLGLALSRLVYALLQPQQLFFDPVEGGYLGLWPLLALTGGGFSLVGLLLGLLLAGWLHARLSGAEVADTLDWLAQPLALFVCALRFGQLLAGAGYGGEVWEEQFQRLPFAVENSFGEWYLAVFLLEGLLMLLILLYLQRGRRLHARPGDQMLRLLTLFLASLIFTESLRQDKILRLEGNSFIRLNQLLGLAGLIIILLMLTRRLLRSGLSKQVALLWAALLLACAGVMAAEFNEKLPVNYALLYGLSALGLLVLSVVVLRALRLSASAAPPLPMKASET